MRLDQITMAKKRASARITTTTKTITTAKIMVVPETMLDTTMIKSAPTTPTTTKENEKNIKMKKNIMGGAEEDGYGYGDEEYAGGEEHYGEYQDGEYRYDDEPERFP